MSEQTGKVKRRKTTSSVAPPETTTRPKSVRQIFMDAICESLERGPATAAEINKRLGFTYGRRFVKNKLSSAGSHTTAFLRIMERQGRVQSITRVAGQKFFGRTDHPCAPILWALVISPDKPRSSGKRHSERSS